mgnify:CR=1 FL=1
MLIKTPIDYKLQSFKKEESNESLLVERYTNFSRKEWLAAVYWQPSYLNGMNLDEALPALPCLTGVYEIENSPK